MGPQADGGGEQVLIIRTSFILSGAHQATQVSDERLMITDFVHTENTEGNGWRSASGRFCGETAIVINWTAIERKIFFNCRYIAGNCCSRKRVGGLWSAIAINDQQLKEKNIY